MNDASKTCKTCEWLEYDALGRAHVCVNANSDNCADFVNVGDTCDKWEKTEVKPK